MTQDPSLSDEITKLKSKIEQIEGQAQNPIRFFFQYVLPVLATLIGVYSVFRTEQYKTQAQVAVEQRKLDSENIKYFFAASFEDDPAKVFMSGTILSKSTDPELAEGIAKTVSVSLLSKLYTKLNEGKINEIHAMVKAAESSDSSVAKHFLNGLMSNGDRYRVIQEYITRFETSYNKELEGFENLKKGDIDGAIRVFQEVDPRYPRYQEVSGIVKTIKQAKQASRTPNSTKDVLKAVIRSHTNDIPKNFRADIVEVANKPDDPFGDIVIPKGPTTFQQSLVADIARSIINKNILPLDETFKTQVGIDKLVSLMRTEAIDLNGDAIDDHIIRIADQKILSHLIWRQDKGTCKLIGKIDDATTIQADESTRHGGFRDLVFRFSKDNITYSKVFIWGGFQYREDHCESSQQVTRRQGRRLINSTKITRIPCSSQIFSNPAKN